MVSFSKTIGFVFGVLILVSLSANAAEVLKIMPLGDSNTRGTEPSPLPGPNPVAIGAGGYRYPLQQMLTKGGYRFDFVGSQTSNAVGERGDNPPATWTYDPTFDKDHNGCAGFSNAGLIAGGSMAAATIVGDPINNAPPLVECLSLYKPDIVLLMSGTNGLDLNNDNVAPQLADLDRLIQTITKNSPTTRVIVSTIFDRWTTSDLSAKDTATINYNAGIPALVKAAQDRGELVSFVDCGGALTRDDFIFAGGTTNTVHPDPTKASSKVAAVWYDGIQGVAPIPEPSALVLLTTALFGMLAYVWKKWK